MREILLVGSGGAWGGTERILVDSARRLAGRAERVSALIATEPGADDVAGRLQREGVDVRRWDEVRALDGHFLRSIRLIRELAPDVVHLHLSWPHANPWLPLAARLAGTAAVVATEHILIPDEHLRDDLRKRAAGRFLDRTVAVSAAIAERLVERWGYARRRVTVIPNGVDLAEFAGRDDARRRAGRERLELDERTLLIGGVGRLEEQKGFVHLVRAVGRTVAEFPRVKLAIAGKGSLAESLHTEARACGLGGALLLPGQLSRMDEFLASLDLFVLPSLWEGMPLSLLEAMATGVPVIAAATPGAREILGDGERLGRLVPPGDEGALADAIGALLRDREAAAALAGSGQAHARERHDAAKLFERIVSVYDELVPETPS